MLEEVVHPSVEEALENGDGQEGSAEEQAPQLANLPRIISLLFVCAKPVTSEALADAAHLEIAEVEDLLAQIREMFTPEEHGFSLHEVAGGWQFRTAPAATRYIRRLIPVKVRRLSRAAAETLAIIAYKQPVERSEIEGIRGVDALPTLRTLLEAKLIRIVGKQDSPGQPVLYGTTVAFLEKFGLRDLSDLPSLRELEQLLAEPGESEQEEAEAASAADAVDGSLADGVEVLATEADDSEQYIAGLSSDVNAPSEEIAG